MIISCPVHVAAQKWADLPAIRQGQVELTFSEFEILVIDQALQFAKLGIGSGDRVAILARNCIEYALAFFSLPRMGASVVPLNLRLTPTDWREHLVQSRAKLVLVDTEHLPLLEGASCKIAPLQRDGAPDRLGSSVTEGAAAGADIDADREATIVFTTGSSGEPKGVRLSTGNHYFNALGSNENIALRPLDCWLVSLPLYHVGGISILHRSALAGATVRITDRFDVDETSLLIDFGSITHISLVPAMLEALLRHRGERPMLRTLRAILLGGAPISLQLFDTCLKSRIPALPSYGLTETASQVCTISPDNAVDQLGTVGRPLRYRQVRIIDANGAPVPDGEVGEIAIKGEVVFMGYTGRELGSHLDSDGWFHTGDMGSLNTAGCLTVVGRRDNMLISGGENISPREIEIAAEAFPGVVCSAVIAIPDPKWGQRPVLFVEPASGSQFNRSEFRHWLVQRLARIKVPEDVILVERMPRLGIGKIDKATLQALYRQPRADHGTD
jgi:o-succinylbenzoate---CoA ligase